MPKKKERNVDPVSQLAQCIALLDDTRAYKRKDVDRIDEAFLELKKTRFKEHYDMWVKARPAADKIADMPLKIPGVEQMIRKLAWIKIANRVGLIVLIGFVAVQIVPAWRRVLGPHPFGGNAFLYSMIAVLVVVVAMNYATYVDYRIRKKVIRYEAETKDEYAPYREKMKDCVNRMLKSLAKEANRSGEKPEDYRMILYYDDYSNIKVVKKWKPKSMFFFKKSFDLHEIVPKL
jgi:hypothetical protein